MRLEIQRDLLLDRRVQELILQNDYLRQECEALLRLLKAHKISTHKLNWGVKQELSIKARRLNHQSRKKYIQIAAPRTVLYLWFKKQAKRMYNSSAQRVEKKKTGAPELPARTRRLVLRIARENPRWGYDTIANVLKMLHIKCSPSSVRNILNAAGIFPAPARDRTQTWHEFLKTQGVYQTDFFTQHALVKNELTGRYEIVCYYLLFFINVNSRKVYLAGMTEHPNQEWMVNRVKGISWDIPDMKYLIMDRDSKFCTSFRETLSEESVEPIQLPPRSPNLNAFAERWVRTVKEECLDHLLIRGKKHLQYVMKEFILHYNHERPHQSLGGRPPEPYQRYQGQRSGPVVKASRLNGLLNSYYLKTA